MRRHAVREAARNTEAAHVSLYKSRPREHLDGGLEAVQEDHRSLAAR
jgi:hypothetical protein